MPKGTGVGRAEHRKQCSRALIVALMLLAMTLGASSPAHSESPFVCDDCPLLYSASNLHSGWAAFKIRSNGSHFALRAFGDDIKGPRQVGFMRFNDQGQGAFGLHWTAATQWAGQHGVLVDVNHEAGDFHMDTMEYPDTPGKFGMEANFNYAGGAAGVATFVLWWVADATWSVEVRSRFGEAANQIVAMRSGTGAFLKTMKDMSAKSTASAQAYMGGGPAQTPWDGEGAMVQVNGQVAVDIKNTLIGGFQQGLTNVGKQTMMTPTGEKTCPRTVPELYGTSCWFTDIVGPNVAGPGTYTLHNTAIGAGLVRGGMYDDVWFGGADVDMPAPLTITDDAFDPQALSLGKGSVLEIVNQDQALHSFTVDGEGIDVDVPAGESISVPISLEPGTYSFRDRHHAGIIGELTVHPAWE